MKRLTRATKPWSERLWHNELSYFIKCNDEITNRSNIEKRQKGYTNKVSWMETNQVKS